MDVNQVLIDEKDEVIKLLGNPEILDTKPYLKD